MKLLKINEYGNNWGNDNNRQLNKYKTILPVDSVCGARQLTELEFEILIGYNPIITDYDGYMKVLKALVNRNK